MATIGILAALASLSPVAQCLELRSPRREAGALGENPFAAGFIRSRDEKSRSMKRRVGSGRALAPQYTESLEYANYTHCELILPQFDEVALGAQLPQYAFLPSPFGLAVGDPSIFLRSREAVHMDPATCASVCSQVSGCALFSATPAEGVTEPCFLYTSECPTPIVIPITPAYTLYTFVGSSGDPHLRNLAGEKFDVNQPDDYLLLRVPREPTKPALLTMRGYVGVAEDAPCALYMKEVTLSGEWLGSKQVQVRSLKGKSVQGTWPNGWPFAMRTSSTGSSKSEGQWMSWETFSSAQGNAGETLPGTINVTSVFRKEEAAAGRVMEAEAFEFRVGTQAAQERASILVAQGSHEGLDISLSKMGMLHEAELGGLLGTEKHDKTVEDRTEQCKASRSESKAKPKMRGMQTPMGSVFTASWA